MRPNLFSRILRSALMLAVIASMVACDVKFEEQITPLVIPTSVTQPDIGTLGPNGTVSPADASATAEAELILTLAALPRFDTFSPNRLGDPRVASYEEVWCGDIERVCYELCFESVCGIYDADNPRVQQFVDAVNDREIKKLEWESKARNGIALDFASFGSCAGTLLAGAEAYVLITAANPEPISKTGLAIGGAIAAGVVCGGTLIGSSNIGADQEVLEAEIERQKLIAEQSFDYLQRYGEEVDPNAAP